jgi:DNA polymerase-3 subunit alpha
LTKRGDRFALFRLEDHFGSVKVICWPEQFQRSKNELVADRAVVLKGKLELADDGTASVIASEIQSLENARLKAAQSIRIKCREDEIREGELDALMTLCRGQSGDLRFVVEIATSDGLRVRVRPADYLRVKLTSQLTAGLQAVNPGWNVELVLSRNGGVDG